MQLRIKQEEKAKKNEGKNIEKQQDESKESKEEKGDEEGLIAALMEIQKTFDVND